jgi:predicted signal transduction protein with EAL and GGDEF domain
VVIAERLRAMLRPMDTVARFGGDEFTLLFEDLDREREVVLIAERVSRAAKLPVVLEDGQAQVTVSIGIATVTDPTVPPEMVIREADTAMYRAKELGRSRYELFDEGSRQRAMERLELEAALSHALERSELRVFYQPKVALGSPRHLIGFEALIRWEHPELGMISPAEFLPLAEETGLILRIGELVFADALAQLARWRQLNAELTVSVNLSARQLADPGLSSLLDAAIRASDVEPSALCIEVSDAALTSGVEAAARSLRALKATGVTISLDDYGTGSTSLTGLRGLPLDELKIHESFVTELGRGRDGEVVAAVVALAHALGMHVVAEGVETDAQLSELSAIGCDGAQGFLLGAPVPGESARSLLAS